MLNTDSLISDIVEYQRSYFPYELYDAYGDYSGGDGIFVDVTEMVETKVDELITSLEEDIQESDDLDQITDAQQLLIKLKSIKNNISITSSCDLFCDDDCFFTRDDIADYIETPLQERIPEIISCRGYIDKEFGKYVLSVDVITDEYEFEGGGALSVTIDMRKIRKPSDLEKYVDDIVAIYKDSVSAYDDISDFALDPYYDDPTQYGSLDDPISPWGGSVL